MTGYCAGTSKLIHRRNIINSVEWKQVGGSLECYVSITAMDRIGGLRSQLNLLCHSYVFIIGFLKKKMSLGYNGSNQVPKTEGHSGGIHSDQSILINHRFILPYTLARWGYDRLPSTGDLICCHSY